MHLSCPFAAPACLRRSAFRLVLPALLLTLPGCPTPDDSADPTDPGQNPPVATEPSFDAATKVALSANDQSTVEGEINAMGEVDLYDLGALAAGDQVVLDVQALDGTLDPVAALFDAREYVLAFNDDRIPDGSDLDPLIDVVIRGADGTYFLGITAFPGTRTFGRYRVSIRITRGVGVPNPAPQIVFLEWRGGSNILIENVGSFTLAPFDAVSLGKEFAGQTETIKPRVQAIVADRFAGFNLILVNSDDSPPPAGPHSTIYFGGEDPRAFAVSEQIDTLNEDLSDDAIVFTESYRAAFGTTPSVEQISTALGNTVAHEIGHLLGMVHTRECSELMDTRCGNSALLFEQTFGVAPLDESVFPLGFQNSVELIGWAIGFLI